MKLKIPVSYNAPVTLTFTILCTLVLILTNIFLEDNQIPEFFTAPKSMTETDGFDYKNAAHYLRLFTHIFGHVDWSHLLGNLAYILLLGPLMEERYGSKMLCLMIITTAFVTGVINVCLIPTPLLGASGICFMLIVLSSLNIVEKKKIPLTFILLVLVYVLKEFTGAGSNENTAAPETGSHISVVAHIAGGLCGSLFGFLIAPKEKRSSSKSEKSVKKESKPATTKKSADPKSFEERESDWRAKWEKIRRERLAKINAASPRNNKVEEAEPVDDDTTVIGTIKL